MKRLKYIVAGVVGVVLASCGTVGAEVGNKPVKVFILAGQSNMEGHCAVRTIDALADDPATAPLFKMMTGADGKPKVCDHVWISYLTGKPDGKSNGVGTGKLTTGFGCRRNPEEASNQIGPEYTFGLRMDEKLDQPVLIIKTAWGGQSLSVNFRPPSAGQVEGVDPAEVGQKYRMMIEHVKQVLQDIKQVVPDYDPHQGYELGGFVWFQGFNDMVDSKTYPKKGNEDGADRFAKYSEWLADLIRDVRKDLNAPEMPFVIGVIGVDGMNAKGTFRDAMAAPAALPEFKGRVVAVPTAPFWDVQIDEISRKKAKSSGKLKELDAMLKAGKLTREEWRKQSKEVADASLTPEEHAILDRGASALGYHYHGSAKFFARAGAAFADALLPFQK